jgi:hypothetical protein
MQIASGYNLPPPLEAAWLTFDRWSDEQLSVEQRAVTPIAPLYHYTGKEALKGILENRHLWCFSHDRQDDVDEFRYSLDVACKELKRIAMEGGKFAKQLCVCVLDLIEKNSLTETFNFYLFSVSLNRDSVLQWKKYGRDSAGFSIGFAPKLFLPDQPTLSPRANENAYVGRVIYGDEKTAYRHRKAIERVAEITHRVAVKNRHLLRSKGVHSDYINAMAKAYIAGQLVWRCITAKRRCWEHQSEVRFVILNQSKHFGGITKTHSDGRPYITYPLPLLDAESIAEIMIGRSAASDAERGSRNCLGIWGIPQFRQHGHPPSGVRPIKIVTAVTVADSRPLPA